MASELDLCITLYIVPGGNEAPTTNNTLTDKNIADTY